MRLHDVRISRVGDMVYGPGQTPVPVGANGIAIVSRDEAVVFSEDSLASWVGKPVTIKHPAAAVTVDNWPELAQGHIENARRGSPPFSDFMVGDVLVTRADAIALAEAGCEISGGYDAAYEQTGPGRGKQTRIVGNHLAFLPDGIKGRCGEMCYVGDQSMDVVEEPKTMTDRSKLFGGSASLLRRLVGAKDDADVQAVLDEAVAGEHAEVVTGMQATIDDQAAQIVTLTTDLATARTDLAAAKTITTDSGRPVPTADSLTALRPRVATAAEILSPGATVPTVDATVDLVATADALCACQRGALASAYKTTDGKVIIDGLLGGADPATLTADEVQPNFFAAAQLMGLNNNAVFAAMAMRATAGGEVQSNIDRSQAASKASAERWGKRRDALNTIN